MRNASHRYALTMCCISHANHNAKGLEMRCNIFFFPLQLIGKQEEYEEKKPALTLCLPLFLSLRNHALLLERPIKSFKTSPSFVYSSATIIATMI